MSTKKKDRNESPIEYLETVKKLLDHSLEYFPKLGDKRRTLIQVPMLGYVRKILELVVFVNREKEDVRKRVGYIYEVFSWLDIFELQLSVIQKHYEQCITSYGWLHFGELIYFERRLLEGLLKKLKV